MRRTAITARLFAIASLAILLAVPAQAQSQPAHPDLSGTWKLNLAKSKTGNHGFTDSETMVVRCLSQTIQVHFASAGHDWSRTYIVDGKEHSDHEMVSGSVQVLGYSKAVWNSSTLVVEFRVHLDDPENPSIKTPDSYVTQRWALSGNGRALTVSSLSSGSTAALSSIQVYDKQ